MIVDAEIECAVVIGYKDGSLDRVFGLGLVYIPFVVRLLQQDAAPMYNSRRGRFSHYLGRGRWSLHLFEYKIRNSGHRVIINNMDMLSRRGFNLSTIGELYDPYSILIKQRNKYILCYTSHNPWEFSNFYGKRVVTSRSYFSKRGHEQFFK